MVLASSFCLYHPSKHKRLLYCKALIKWRKSLDVEIICEEYKRGFFISLLKAEEFSQSFRSVANLNSLCIHAAPLYTSGLHIHRAAGTNYSALFPSRFVGLAELTILLQLLPQSHLSI